MKSRPRTRWFLGVPIVLAAVLGTHAQSPTVDELNEQLSAAAAKGDLPAVQRLVAQGADVNAENANRGATPLYTAVEHARYDVARFLLDHGADPNAKDLEWGRTPLRIASIHSSDPEIRRVLADIVVLLLERGAGPEGESVPELISRGHYAAARTIISRGGMLPGYLNRSLEAAQKASQQDLVDLLVKAGAREPAQIDRPRAPERLKLMTGVYRSQAGTILTILPGLLDDELLIERPGGRSRLAIFPVDLTLLRSHDMKVRVQLNGGTLPPPEVTLREGGTSAVFVRSGDAPTRAAAPTRSRALPPPSAYASSRVPTNAAYLREWPSLRGPNGAGVADGARPPSTWDLETGTNIRWKTPIPGFGHGSPIVWGNRVFITTAVPQGQAQKYLTGVEAGSLEEWGNRSTRDGLPHSWRVYALDKRTGKILWERVAKEGIPRTQRHVQQTQANSTPVTDGRYVVAFFGSEGLYCYDMDGSLVWQKDLGALRSAYVMDPTYEWTTANSPIIYEDLLVLQVDKAEDSFIATFELKTGKEVWRKTRDEVASFSTPVIYHGPRRIELLTLASNYARSYDPLTGRELWRMGRNATHATPLPVFGRGLIFLTSGTGSTSQPIYAVRSGAEGDITLADDQASNEWVVWSKRRGGAYMSTPIFYQDVLYVASDPGILSAYNGDTGDRVYQQRLPSGSGTHNYTASIVAADGRLYLATQDGDVVVVKAGPTYELLAVNKMDEPILATPAISGDMIIVRTRDHVIGVAESK